MGISRLAPIGGGTKNLRMPTIRAKLSLLLTMGTSLLACGSDEPAATVEDAVQAPEPNDDGLTLRSEVQAITRADDAQPGVFIPMFERCSEPLGDDVGKGPDGQVCTNIAISGSTEEGKLFTDYGDCDIVRTQRPFWPRPPAGESDPDDPRLDDEEFMGELAWMTEQVEASACVCCHDSDEIGGQAGNWDIRLGPIWLDSLADSGLALFIGLADSSTFGAFPKEENNGFDRTLTGIPTTDTERMQAFLRAEMERRGLTEEEARAVPPFGGPIYANSVAAPEPCGRDQGVDEDGVVHWTGGPARYVYVLEEGSDNPGVPPNRDLPEGTLWRLDVLASEDALKSGIDYGTTPEGSFQAIPERERAPELEQGTTYHLYALRDVGVSVTNCLFVYGEPLGSTAPDAGAPATGNVDPAVCEGSAAFGSACSADSDCSCEAASYCAIMPGQAEGFCTATGCVEDASVCPAEWSCFDLSAISSGAPSFCLEP